MKLNSIFAALMFAFVSVSAVAHESGGSKQSTETLPVQAAENPVALSSKASNLTVRSPKPVPIKTTGYTNPNDLALPGIGVMPGVNPEMHDNVIRITSNRTEVINVSAGLANRIATPFANPKAILLDDGATVHADGQSLYVALNGSPEPVALYVTGSGANDPVVSLTLIPQSLPPQTIVLQLDGLDKTIAGGPGGSRHENPSSPIYTESIVSILRSVALGKTPEGFVQGRLPVAAADFGNFTAIPIARVSSSAYDVYRYRLVTESATTIELEESAFAAAGVRAVAFFPSALIAKNVPTEVFILADKKATVTGVY